jgi:hypothetical protein
VTTQKFVEVVEIDTRKVEHRIEVTGKPQRQIDKAVRGLLRQINTDKYFVSEPEPV